jgi:hypothetical protein
VSDIELKISLELTEALIARRMADVFGEEAQALDQAAELARELHAIINAYRALRSVEPPYMGSNRFELMDIERIEEPDMVFAILNTALGWWPKDEASQGLWIWEQFDKADADELWRRWARLCDRINGAD